MAAGKIGGATQSPDHGGAQLEPQVSNCALTMAEQGFSLS